MTEKIPITLQVQTTTDVVGVLEDEAEKQGLTASQAFRCAVALYQSRNDKMRKGFIMTFVDAEGRVFKEHSILLPHPTTKLWPVVHVGCAHTAMYLTEEPYLWKPLYCHMVRTINGNPISRSSFARCGYCGGVINTWRIESATTTNPNDLIIPISNPAVSEPKPEGPSAVA